MGKISDKLLEGFRRYNLDNVINLLEVNEAKSKLEAINSELANRFEFDIYDPSFRVYSSLQNLISYFSEEISIIDEFTEYYDAMVEMDGEFMPSYPPVSPVSGAYFTYWCFFDFKFGKERETIGSIFFDIGLKHKFDNLILRAIENLNNSSMRFYKHLGIEDDLIKLKDLLSGETFSCISTSNYLGKENEIWFVRLVQNLDHIYEYQIVLTTPYIILNSKEKDWIDFFDRQSDKIKKIGFKDVLDELNNSKSKSKYWHNYIMEAYSSYESNCIFLTGIPDVKGSKPYELF